MAAQLLECTSSANIAAKTQEATGVKLSPRSVRRLLRKKELTAPDIRDSANAET